MAISAQEYAALCQAAYDGADGGGNDNTSWSVGQRYGDWKVAGQTHTSQSENDLEAGFSAVIFQKPGNPPETVVVFKGTDFSTYGDAATDVNLGVGANNAQYEALDQFLAENRGKLKGDVTFAGHSLGGNLAMHATVTSGVDANCVTFNAPGFSDEYIRAHPQFNAMGDRITEYQNERDIVSSIGHHPGQIVIGKSKGFGLNHDLSDLDFDENGSLIMREPPIKAGRCYVVQALSTVLDKMAPEGGIFHTFVITALEIVYADPALAVALLIEIVVLAPGMVATILVAALCILIVAIALELELMVAEWIAENIIEPAIEIARRVIDEVVAVGVMLADAAQKLFTDIRNGIQDLCKDIGEALQHFWDSLFGQGGAGAQHLSVNTGVLRHASQRLRAVNSRIVDVDHRLNRLRSLLEPSEWQQWLTVAGVDLRVGYSFRVLGCVSYLTSAADRLDGAESELTNTAWQFK